MAVIKLLTSDNVIIETEMDLIMCSGTIKGMLESCSGDDEIVPLPKVRSAILTKILQWAQFHRYEFADTTAEEEAENVCGVISPWDSDFINVDMSTLVELIEVANFLNIQRLLQLACKTAANMIAGKTSEDMRKILNIKNDLTFSEEAVMRKESK
ncbi:S-phase kinase-associated protein 1-like isoform X1 [Drosophila albomicans]|uniref:S-phase kinase-associated protein 1-like isoform X1 n=2 Tax=Drosophila albomicans TaxID=7291 RepID=A0A9C6SQU1_DROAB|nr:S-phase kinase-associated protein 1-like isoform X1 [Drosophila albomicans]